MSTVNDHINEMIANHREQIESLEELRASLAMIEQGKRDYPVEQVSFNRDQLKRFKRMRDDTAALNKDVFVFDGREYVVSYANYLIEYLEKELGVAA